MIYYITCLHLWNKYYMLTIEMKILMQYLIHKNTKFCYRVHIWGLWGVSDILWTIIYNLWYLFWFMVMEYKIKYGILSYTISTDDSFLHGGIRKEKSQLQFINLTWYSVEWKRDIYFFIRSQQEIINPLNCVSVYYFHWWPKLYLVLYSIK